MKRFITLFALIVVALAASVLAQEKYQPAIFYSNLMGNIKVQDDGRLKILPMFGAFLPDTKGHMRVLLDGNEIGKYEWTAYERNKPFFQIPLFEFISGDQDPRGLKLTKGGNYEFVFDVNGKAFQRFKFNLTKKNVGTKYKPKYSWQKDGDWDDYVYLLKDKDGRGKWYFKYYVRSDVFTNDCTSQVFLKRDADNKLIAKTGSVSCSRSPVWKRTDQLFKSPTERPESPGSNWKTDRFEANNYVFKDGTYTIEHKLNGKLHATYKFTVKDNEIQPQGRQIRGAETSVDFIEGGGTTYWLKKQ